MNAKAPTKRARVMLSFSSAYKDLARRIRDDLVSANIEVRYDSWEGGGGVPAMQSVPGDIGRASFLLPLLTPSDAAPTWMSEKWRRTIYDVARSRDVEVLPIRGDGGKEVIPEYLRNLHFADLSRRGYREQLSNLVAVIRDTSGDSAVGLPAGWIDEHSVAPSPAPTDPIVLEVGEGLAPIIMASAGSTRLVDEMFPFMRDGLFYELGVQYPALRVRVESALSSLSARVLINEVPESHMELQRDAVLVNDDVDTLVNRGFPAQPGTNPATGADHAWIPIDQASLAVQEGLTVWDTHEVLILQLSAVLRRKAADFLSMGAVRGLLEQVESRYPNTVSETVPNTLSLFVLTDVLRRLVVEGISIRDLRRILLAMADWGRVEQDPLMLTEYARAALQRAITDRMSGGTNTLVVFLLEAAIEELIANATKYTATGSYVDLSSDRLRQILDAVGEPIGALDSNTQVPLILTQLGIRSSIRRLVAPTMPSLHVISYQELSPDVNIQPVGRISLEGFRGRAGVKVGGVPIWG